MTEGPWWSIAEAVGHLHPPIERRELARILEPHRRSGKLRYGGAGRRPMTYPVALILRVHREWMDARDG